MRWCQIKKPAQNYRSIPMEYNFTFYLISLKMTETKGGRCFLILHYAQYSWYVLKIKKKQMYLAALFPSCFINKFSRNNLSMVRITFSYYSLMKVFSLGPSAPRTNQEHKNILWPSSKKKKGHIYFLNSLYLKIGFWT